MKVGFFTSWQLKGKYPEILTHDVVGEEATKLFQDANNMLAQIVKEKWLTAKGVIGLFPANAVGDDVAIYKDETRKEEVIRFINLRQQRQKAKGLPNLSLTDYIAPAGLGNDYIGGFAVSTGFGIEPHVPRPLLAVHNLASRTLAPYLLELGI